MTPEQYRAIFCPSDTGAAGDGLSAEIDRQTASPMGPILLIAGVGAVLLWAVAQDNRKRARA